MVDVIIIDGGVIDCDSIELSYPICSADWPMLECDQVTWIRRKSGEEGGRLKLALHD